MQGPAGQLSFAGTREGDTGRTSPRERASPEARWWVCWVVTESGKVRSSKELLHPRAHLRAEGERVKDKP